MVDSKRCKRKTFTKDSYNLTIYTDASKTGWGGHMDDISRKGWWTEKNAHKGARNTGNL